MNILLFEFNLKLAFLFAFIFLFIIPIFLIQKGNRSLGYIYLYLYFLMLMPGVFLNVDISKDLISFSLLHTTKWFNNQPSLAFFDPLMIIINLLLLFPLGAIFPIISKTKKNLTPKIILLGFLVTFSIELLQFSLPIRRYPELLDIINNVISVILGYQYYLIIKLLSRGVKHDQLSKQKSYTNEKRVYKLRQKRNES